ncbi:MAG: alpha/beta hydrolase [Betaproteobacteria bacterium]|nr:alpha/beta hydrolase [Betaproteobacteria bacterium]NBY05074.1 alpha/beta hydrolase [Betaproteobacteria bacterium]
MPHMKCHGVALEVRHIPASPAAPALAPIVFLHEGLGSVAMWTQRGLDWPAQVCQASGRSGWVYSREGYGQSDDVANARAAGALPPHYLHTQAWEVLPEFLAQAGITHPVLLGHSDGASIALLYASRHRVSACIAMAPHVIVEDMCIAAIQQTRTAYEGGDLRQRLARFHAQVDTAFWRWNDIWLSPAFRGLDIRQQCQSIADPVLALQGRQDAYGTLQQIHDIWPQGRIERVVLEDCGHTPHRDQPAQALAAVVDFLASIHLESQSQVE